MTSKHDIETAPARTDGKGAPATASLPTTGCAASAATPAAPVANPAAPATGHAAPSRRKAFVLLGISIVLEVFGAAMMKYSDGFSNLLFTGISLSAYLVSFSLLIIILKHLPLGLVYGIWGGVGTVLTMIVGIVCWGEPLTILVSLGVILIIAGVYLLNKGSEEIEASRAKAE